MKKQTSKTATPTYAIIPVANLLYSKTNVRKTGGQSIADLADSIAAHGLLQNLGVIPAAKKNFYEVVAGGRRLRAIKELIASKRWPVTSEIMCLVGVDSEALEVSLAENTLRESMHPADQHAAFRALVDANKPIAEVASRFGVTELFVKQRLKLSSVAPELLQLYREGKATLDQMMALTLTDDHTAQREAWKACKNWNGAAQLKAALLKSEVRADDRRVKFVTLAAYEAAGGAVRRDMFSTSEYAADPVLLDQLVSAKLAKRAEAVKKEGFGWVEIRLQRDYGELQRFDRLEPTLRAPTAKEATKIAQLTAEIAEINAATENDEAEELDERQYAASRKRYKKATDALKALKQGLRKTEDKDAKALAGAIVFLDHAGKIEIERNLVRRENRAALVAVQPFNDKREESGKSAPGEPRDEGGLSDALTRRLTVERTLALQASVSASPAAALSVLVHALVTKTFFEFSDETALDASVGSRTSHGEPVPDSLAVRALATRYETLRAALPKEASDVWVWATTQPQEVLLDYLAHCVALGVNAIVDRRGGDRTWSGRPISASHTLAQWLKFDMADWWSPTAEAYLGSVSKTLLTEAVQEVKGKPAADALSKLKKAAAVAAAEEALAGSRWLPALLREPKVTVKS